MLAKKDIAQYQRQICDGLGQASPAAIGTHECNWGLFLRTRHCHRGMSNVPAWEEAEHKQWQQRRMEVYAAQVTVMDAGIGRIIEALKATKRFEKHPGLLHD